VNEVLESHVGSRRGGVPRRPRVGGREARGGTGRGGGGRGGHDGRKGLKVGVKEGSGAGGRTSEVGLSESG